MTDLEFEDSITLEDIKEVLMDVAVCMPFNEVMVPDAGDYYVSYNPSCTLYGDGSETALVTQNYHEAAQVGKFFILYGDWRDEYKKVIGDGLDACMRVFNDNKRDNMSFWSEDEAR